MMPTASLVAFRLRLVMLRPLGRYVLSDPFQTSSFASAPCLVPQKARLALSSGHARELPPGDGRSKGLGSCCHVILREARRSRPGGTLPPVSEVHDQAPGDARSSPDICLEP